MTLYQKFIELTGLLHISEADFNAAMDPKTDTQKALRGFIGWSIGKTDANSDAALFRKTIDYKYTEKVDNYTAVTNLSNFGDTPSVDVVVPTVKPTMEEHKNEPVADAVVPSTEPAVGTVSDEHKNEPVADVVAPSTEPAVGTVSDEHKNEPVADVVAPSTVPTVKSTVEEHIAPAVDGEHKETVAEPTVKPVVDVHSDPVAAVADTDHKETDVVPSTDDHKNEVADVVAPVADTHSETAVSASDDHVTSNAASTTSGSEVTNGVTEHSTLEVH